MLISNKKDTIKVNLAIAEVEVEAMIADSQYLIHHLDAQIIKIINYVFRPWFILRIRTATK